MTNIMYGSTYFSHRSLQYSKISIRNHSNVKKDVLQCVNRWRLTFSIVYYKHFDFCKYKTPNITRHWGGGNFKYVEASCRGTKLFGCVRTHQCIVSLILNYVEKLTEDDAAAPESPLLPSLVMLDITKVKTLTIRKKLHIGSFVSHFVMCVWWMGLAKLSKDLNWKCLNSENLLKILQSFSFISNMRTLVNMAYTPKGMECLKKDLNLKSPNSENLLNIPDTKSQILQSFSFISNMRTLVNMTSTPRGMECLNGIRVLSMGWFILGHIYPSLHVFTSKYTIFVLIYRLSVPDLSQTHSFDYSSLVVWWLCSGGYRISQTGR